MKIIEINQKNPQRNKIKKVVKFLKTNKVVILPTDTCYGMMGRADDAGVVLKIYKIKGRAFKKPLSCIFQDLKMIKKFVYLGKVEKKIIKKFLPGPLTLILKRRKNLPNVLTAGKKFIGVRIPKNKIIRAIMEKINFPITATSANLSGENEPYTLAEILRQYKNRKTKPDFIVDAGSLKKIRPSTVVKIKNGRLRILRKGPISKNQIKNETLPI
jgi:L-threonylcarbamoyladenylate synthase